MEQTLLKDWISLQRKKEVDLKTPDPDYSENNGM